MWKFTAYDERTPSDSKSSHGLWPGELKMLKAYRQRNSRTGNGCQLMAKTEMIIWYRHPNSEAGNDEIQNVQRV
jgi:hypothetical protein